jgi:hypothetical protein
MTNMETISRPEIKYSRFIAGGPDDPRDQATIGRCVDCNRIVRYSRVLEKWVYDNGQFHNGHLIEVPQE